MTTQNVFADLRAVNARLAAIFGSDAAVEAAHAKIAAAVAPAEVEEVIALFAQRRVFAVAFRQTTD